MGRCASGWQPASGAGPGHRWDYTATRGAGAAETFAFNFAVYEIDTSAPGQKGPPVADALVAVDLPSGERRELTTAPDGRVELVVPADASWITWTVAKPGLFPVTTFYRARIEEVETQIAADGELYAVMEAQPPPVSPPRVELAAACSIDCCISRQLGGWCLGLQGTAPVEQRSQPYPLTAIAMDAEGCAAELAESTLPDTLTDQTVHFAFDGADSTEPVLFDMTLLLPTDGESLIAEAGMNTGAGLPVRVNDHSVNRTRGFACNHRSELGARRHDLTVGYFPKAGAELDMEIRAYPTSNPDDPTLTWSSAMSARSFQGIAQPGSYEMLDIPRLSSPTDIPARTSRFSWQPVPGATMYELHVQTDLASWLLERIDRTLWLAVSWSHQDITLPEPPAGYDPEEQWGEPAVGEYRVVACDRWLPWSNRRLWWEPRAAADVGCGFGQSMDGPLY